MKIEFLSAETGQLKVFNNSFDDLRITIQNKSDSSLKFIYLSFQFI